MPAGKFKYLSGDEGEWEFTWPAAILAGGISIQPFIVYKNCDSGFWDTKINNIDCGRIIVDIDEPKKGKYTYGMDLFQFEITKEGLKPAALSAAALADDMAACTEQGWGCGEWVMDFGNMDYLNAGTDGKCKNDESKVLGYGEGKVQSCK